MTNREKLSLMFQKQNEFETKITKETRTLNQANNLINKFKEENDNCICYHINDAIKYFAKKEMINYFNQNPIE